MNPNRALVANKKMYNISSSHVQGPSIFYSTWIMDHIGRQEIMSNEGLRSWMLQQNHFV